MAETVSTGRIEKAAKKKRAPAACRVCRAKKVRCDVHEHGSPCTNCRLDGVGCDVVIGKTPVKLATFGFQSYLGGFVAEKQRPVDAGVGGERGRMNVSGRNGGKRGSAGKGSAEGVFQSMETGSTIGGNRGSPAAASSQPQHGRQQSSGRQNTAQTHDTPHHMPSDFTPTIQPARKPVPSLPAWLRQPSKSLDADDIDYLQRANALSIPSDPLRDECLASFIDWFYPWSPSIDLSHLLSIMADETGRRGAFSLLVFQAIMFAGVGCVNIESLHLAGFQTRKDAKRHFFRKVKLLYDFGYESNQINIIQTLLVMSYWVESSDDQKDIWHWVGVAVGLAFKIGLHRDPSSLPVDMSEKRLRKRLWWSLFTRDRLVALAMRRYTQIQQNTCSVPHLTEDDFDMQRIAAEHIKYAHTPYLQDTRLQKFVAIWCIEQIKLCSIIGLILQVQYSTVCIDRGTSLESQANTKTTMALMPRYDHANSDSIALCYRNLEDWLASLPQIAAYHGPNQIDPGGDTLPENFLLHRASLTMLYFTTINVFYRPLITINSQNEHSLNDLPSLPTPIAIGGAAFQKARAAASMITHIAKDLNSLNLIRFLQPFAVTSIVSASMVHLVEIQSPVEEIQRESFTRLFQCLTIIEQLQDVYIAADLACYLLYAGIRDARILPALSSEDAILPAAMAPPDPPAPQQQENNNAWDTSGAYQIAPSLEFGLPYEAVVHLRQSEMEYAQTPRESFGTLSYLIDSTEELLRNMTSGSGLGSGIGL